MNIKLHPVFRFHRPLSVALTAALTLAWAGAAQATPAIEEFTVTPAKAAPASITSGPNGELWFTEVVAGRVAAMSTAGIITTSFSTPGDFQTEFPARLIEGPDGNLWFAVFQGNSITRITPSGTLTNFPLPTADAEPVDIVVGPDGNLWFTEYAAGKIGRISPSNGAISEFATPTEGSGPLGITVGPDDNLWFAESGPGQLGRFVIASKATTEFPIPGGVRPFSLTAGSDGNLWFTAAGADEIGRMTPAGTTTLFNVPTAEAEPFFILSGPDGNLWFTEFAGGKIGMATTAGKITELTIPTANSQPAVMTTGPDGNLWFAESNVNKIGKVLLAAPSTCVPNANTLCIDDQPGDKRWEITSSYHTSQSGGLSGNGNAISLSTVDVTQGGLFWFFGADNPEMLIKVLNGCAVDQHFWVFYAATTNVGFTVTVTDTKIGRSKQYSNADLTAAPPVQDTAAFVCTAGTDAVSGDLDQAGGPTDAGARVSTHGAAGAATVPATAATVPALPAIEHSEGGAGDNVACTTTSTSICIDGRFLLQSTFKTTEGGGKSGAGQAISLASVDVTQGGLFWFFSSTNPEMLIKVIDGCAVDGKYWVFYAATTNVGFQVTVTDTVTGKSVTYKNTDGVAAAPVQDTSALPCTPAA